VRTSNFTCPACGYNGLAERPRSADGGGSYEICPSCGFEFGVSDDDLGFSYETWRRRWIAEGMRWSGSEPEPDRWDPASQLANLAADGA